MKRASIIAERVRGRDLQPGDMFSTLGQEYWDQALNNASIGQSVYIRTNTPTIVAPDPELFIHRIIIVVIDEQ